MQTDEITADMQERAGLEQDPARRTLIATTRALGWVLSGEDATDVAAQLPAELATELERSAEQDRSLGLEGFVIYVAEQTGTDGETARSRIGHALASLRTALDIGKHTDPTFGLPENLHPLLPG